MAQQREKLYLTRLGIDSYKEAIVYMREDCPVCRSEGLNAHARVRITHGDHYIIATLNTISSKILEKGHAGLSEYAWKLLGANEKDLVGVSHARPILSMSHVRSKIYGNRLSADKLKVIIEDISAGLYADIHIASFLSACAGGHMDMEETVSLTHAMVNVGNRINWPADMVVDKHCVGGLPGNRTTPIVVSIVAAFGLLIPKTSSRAITSPAGTADTMEVLAPVDLDIKSMRRVVEQENGCIVWGGSVDLSPADDLLIQVEKALDLDSEGQLVASIISKKISAGSRHVLIDIPVGPTAKIRDLATAQTLENKLVTVGQKLGISVRTYISDGTVPVGRGIGPALEARDVVAVLKGDTAAPQDLKERAILLAGHILEFCPDVIEGHGMLRAREILESGHAWQKFQAICEAQGGMREIPEARYKHIVPAQRSGIVAAIDNRKMAMIAKFAGAPYTKAAGVDLHIHLAQKIDKGTPLFSIHANSPGELTYSLNFLAEGNHIIQIEEE